MPQTFLFYDIETSGLNKAFDQVLQFAAIRTDLKLNELARYEILIKLNPDNIPSPQAMLTHKLRIHELNQGVCEYEGIKYIHALMNTPGTLSLGYNTLGFDDEFLRFSFYRNLLSPYTHQYANGCGRLDLYPMAIMYHLFKSHILEWPIHEGKISLKLENLNQANQLTHGQAHHAMADAEATLALARIFYQDYKTWDYLLGYFNKKIDRERIQSLALGLCVEGKMGADNFYQCPAKFLGQHKHYLNQWLWLRLDTEFTHITGESVSDCWVMRKKLAEPCFILPMQERFLKTLSAERKERMQYNQALLEGNTSLLNRITEYFTQYTYPIFKDTDVEARLYLHGFFTPEDELFCRRFHLASPLEKADLIHACTHPILKALAIRILGKHFPESLPPLYKVEFDNYMFAINPDHPDKGLIDFKGKKRITPKCAFQQIAEFYKSISAQHLPLLQDLEQYLRAKFPQTCNTPVV